MGSIAPDTTDTLAESVRAAALDAVDQLLSVRPPRQDGSKAPLADVSDGRGGWTWKLDRRASRREVETWYAADRDGVGLCTGAVSCGLEVLEFDDAATYTAFVEAAHTVGLGGLVGHIAAGYCEASPGDGIHWYYYCDEVRGSTKLAVRLEPGNAKHLKTLIETKGEGGYIIAAPSGGRVHPTGRPYRLLSGRFESIVTISSADRDSLWNLARTFDETLIPPVSAEARNGASTHTPGDVLPGADFNARAIWQEVLADWTFLGSRGDTQYLRRPGKDRGVSAAIRRDRLNVYSSSTPLESVLTNRKTYDKFGAFAALNHAGDIREAARALSRAGYGTPPAKPVDPTIRPQNGVMPVNPAVKPTAATFSNFVETTREPLRMGEIADALETVAPGWPKRVGVDQTLFLESPEHEPVLLGSPSRLFSWIDRLACVDWSKGGRYVTQERFYEDRRMNASHYEAIETLPHWPRIGSIFYMHRSLPRPAGALEMLLGFFAPATEIDRELIRSFVLTCFWGGEPGSRPGFLVTGPGDDPHQGRGVGKTRLLDLVAELVGGFVDVSPTDQIADVKTRLLSDAARQIRLARLDNVKSLKFSWADLEGLITSTEISGRRLYSGEGRRPNTIVWGITLNGATLSKDLAQRVIPIQLARPSYSAEWERDSREFVRANRWEILADIGEILSGPRRKIAVRSRWATWEEEVLSRCIGVSDCQVLIASRQDAVDEDAGEQDTLREYFADQLSLHGFSASMQKIFIPNSVASIWVNRASNQKLSTNRATSYLASLGVRELRKSALTGRKGWTWTGENASTIATAIPLPSHLVEEIVGGHRP